MTRPLDFLIIGAQKGGTTSLFRYLASHPEVYLPPEKEAPFFHRDELYARGWDAFARERFADAPPHARWGKATPHYMCDARVPARIHATMPDVRLIALLRHPVERAYSHYLMSRRRGHVARPFDEVVAEQLEPAALERARALPATPEHERACYVAWGEYGRILGGFLEHFPREQLLALFTDDLARDPQGTLERVYAYLGVRGGVIPPELGARFNVGGSRRRDRKSVV